MLPPSPHGWNTFSPRTAERPQSMSTDSFPSTNSESPEEGGPDLGYLLLGLGRYRFLVVLTTVLGAVAGLLAGFSRPNTYMGEAKLQLNLGQREALTAERSAGVEADIGAVPAMVDEIVLLNSDAVIRETVAKVGAERVLVPHDPREGDTPGTFWLKRVLHEGQARVFDWKSQGLKDGSTSQEQLEYLAAKALKANTQIADIRRSNLISVQVSATSPRLAKELADALAATCVEEHQRAFSAQGFVELNKSKREVVYQNLISAQRGFHEHVDVCGFVELDTQLPRMIEDLHETTRTLEQSRAQLEGKRAQLSALRTALQELPKTIERETPATMGPNPQIVRLEESLRDVRLEKMREVRNPSLQDSERARAEVYYDELIRSVQGELDALPRVVEVVPPIISNVSNPERESITSQVIELDAEVSGLIRSVALLEGAAQRETARLDAARSCQPIHADLRRTIDDKERQLGEIDGAATELEMLSMLEDQGQSNLRLFQSSTIPTEKEGPDRLKVLVLATAAGLILGAALAIGLQASDERVRYPMTIEGQLGLPVLASVRTIKGLDAVGPIDTARQEAQAG